MQQLQLAPVPTQRLQVTLAGQPCDVEIRSNGDALYLSLWLNNAPVMLTKICRDRQLMLTGSRYHGFAGDLLFIDNQGAADPRWSGLGTRYVLVYITAAETP